MTTLERQLSRINSWLLREKIIRFWNISSYANLRPVKRAESREILSLVSQRADFKTKIANRVLCCLLVLTVYLHSLSLFWVTNKGKHCFLCLIFLVSYRCMLGFIRFFNKQSWWSKLATFSSASLRQSVCMLSLTRDLRLQNVSSLYIF